MTDRNYDYLPGDAEGLRSEIAALDRRVTELEAERDAAVAAAVAAEREAIAAMIESHSATDDDGNRLYDLGHWESEWYVLDAEKIVAAIRSRP